MKTLTQHMIKTNNEDFFLKFRFLRPANNYMHASYGQANKLEGVLVLCLGAKAVVFLQYLHKYHVMLSSVGLNFAGPEFPCTVFETPVRWVSHECFRSEFFQDTIAFLVYTVSLTAFNCSVEKFLSCSVYCSPR